MCNPSSSAERTRATAATDWAQRYSHDLIHQAYAVGPATAWFVQLLCKQAAQADLKGQLPFPFITRELTEADRQSGNQDQSAGLPRTSLRYSW